MAKQRKSRRSRRRVRPSESQVAFCQDRALTALETGKLEEAIAWAESALGLLERLRGHLPWANCLQLIAFIQSQQGLYEEAIESVGAARTVYLDHGEIKFVAECDSFIAFNLQRSRRSTEAMAKLEASRVLYLESGDFAKAADCEAVARHWADGRETGMRVTRAGSKK